MNTEENTVKLIKRDSKKKNVSTTKPTRKSGRSIMPKGKECSRCHKIKIVSEFYENKSFTNKLGKFGLRSACKECTIIKNIPLSIEWRLNNTEKSNSAKREWQRKNKHKHNNKRCRKGKNNCPLYQKGI